MSDVVISGIGQSAIGRFVDRSPLELTSDAILDALQDSGLQSADIDGLASWPGVTVQAPPGFSTVSITSVKEAFRFKLNWYSGGLEGPGQFASLVNAYAAIKAGFAKHVICFRTITEGRARAYPNEFPSFRPPRISDESQWLLPFQTYSAANWVAQYAQRHFHEYGTTREQLAQITLNARRNAALNPKAIYRDPLTIEDYLNARMISSPLCLYDCDAPTDASTAIILSAADAAKDLRKPPVHIEAIGSALNERDSWDQIHLTRTSSFDAAAQMWSRTDLKPKDVDVAQLYDGFSILTMIWLEAMGFCKEGESGSFVEGGQRISRDGELPLNTSGGQLAAGRVHGLGYIHEACLQLRGEAQERQLAKQPKVAACSAGGGPLAVAMLLRING
jgi:acetyl-CoA acetyltransferase